MNIRDCVRVSFFMRWDRMSDKHNLWLPNLNHRPSEDQSIVEDPAERGFQYRCEDCGEVKWAERSPNDMMAEAVKLFGMPQMAAADDPAILCDDCFNKSMIDPRIAQVVPPKPPAD